MRVYLRTFGCRANQYDTETVRAMVERAGGVVVGSPEDADVAVFNSCAVTAEAEADLRKAVRAAARRSPGVRSIVMGCSSALRGDSLLELPGVSHAVAGADFAAVAAALGLGLDALGPATRQSGTRALLRIQDGCDEHCTFCATTLARGANRSRPVELLLSEAAVLGESHAEIVLTGVHIGTYGRDTGGSLGLLVERLVGSLPAVRFRLSSLEATEVDERLADVFAEPRRLAPHLHAPLQSGSDRVLRRMGRHWYTAHSYAAAVERLAGSRTVFALGADVIAGFPGESEADHQASVGLVEQLPFTYLHVFPYSARPGTAATRLGAQVPSEVIERRASELRAVSSRRGLAHAASRAGGTADVVVLRGGKGRALTEDFLEVHLASAVPGPRRIDVRLDFMAGALRAVPLASPVTQ